MQDSLAGITGRRFAVVLLSTGLLVALVGIGGLVAIALGLGGQAASDPDLLIFMVALSTACIVPPLAWLVVARGGVSWRTLGWRGTSGRFVIVAVVTAIAYLTLGSLVYDMAGLGPALDEFLVRDMGAFVDLSDPNPLRVAALLLTIGPLAAIAEELMFRGFVYGWLRNRIGPTAAAGISAAAFALVHFHFIEPGGLLGFAAVTDIFLTGLILTWLYQASGSLVPPIVMHATNNIAIVLIVIWAL